MTECAKASFSGETGWSRLSRRQAEAGKVRRGGWSLGNDAISTRLSQRAATLAGISAAPGFRSVGGAGSSRVLAKGRNRARRAAACRRAAVVPPRGRGVVDRRRRARSRARGRRSLRLLRRAMNRGRGNVPGKHGGKRFFQARGRAGVSGGARRFERTSATPQGGRRLADCDPDCPSGGADIDNVRTARFLATTDGLRLVVLMKVRRVNRRMQSSRGRPRPDGPVVGVASQGRRRGRSLRSWRCCPGCNGSAAPAPPSCSRRRTPRPRRPAP